MIIEIENPMDRFKKRVDIAEDRIGEPEDRPKEIPKFSIKRKKDEKYRKKEKRHRG